MVSTRPCQCTSVTGGMVSSDTNSTEPHSREETDSIDTNVEPQASKDTDGSDTTVEPCSMKKKDSIGTSTEPRSKKKRKRENDVVERLSEKLLKAAEARMPELSANASDSRSLSSNSQTNRLPILTTYDQREEFAENLQKLRSKNHERANQIIWANKRYFYDMQYLLRLQRKIRSNKEANRSARSSMLINRIASTLANNNPECCCAVQVYNLFASMKTLL